MKTQVDFAPPFTKALRRLQRKYPLVSDEVNALVADIKANERPGDKIPGVGYDVYKVRLSNPSAGRGKRGGFRFEAWEDLLYYYKGHPDGVLDALAVFIYLEFTDALNKITNDLNLDKHNRERADGLKSKIKGLMDEILDEATNSADNFPEYI